ncbi:MAG: beta-lactamase family protein [Planctomicrobium sp.]|jgi:beta-lactamase class C|nr:beta-lactamase family protein [Planctomicrobium sp.]
MRRRTVLKTGLGVVLGSPLLAALKQSEVDGAINVMKSATESGQVAGAAMFVQQKETRITKAFGTASDENAIFLLASISKTITVAAIMTLFDQQEFQLNDRVQKFIPEFKGDGREEMTMQQLFTHTCGLPDQLPENAKLRSSHAELSTFIERAIRTPLLFTPGEKYSYSSMGILIATEVAQRISGKTIATLVDETVFKPLNMKHSALGVGNLNREALMPCQILGAAPESGAGNPSTKSWDWNSTYWRQLGVPWGGTHGSVGDVGQFLSKFLKHDGEILEPATSRLMIQNHSRPGLHRRGLGFDLSSRLNGPKNSKSAFGHTGSTGTLCWADPESYTICVILTTLPANAVNPHPRNLAAAHVAASV